MAALTEQLKVMMERLEAANLYTQALERTQSGPADPGRRDTVFTIPVERESASSRSDGSQEGYAPVQQYAEDQSYRIRTDNAPVQAKEVQNALSSLTSQHLAQGIVLSVILGPPASRRKGPSRAGR
ncbi:MAG: hypothetical protein GX153_05280 [Clostridiaceae bacterium]|nr:hypothetical protein [Clostridiaceae bacterium]